MPGPGVLRCCEPSKDTITGRSTLGAGSHGVLLSVSAGLLEDLVGARTRDIEILGGVCLDVDLLVGIAADPEGEDVAFLRFRVELRLLLVAGGRRTAGALVEGRSPPVAEARRALGLPGRRLVKLVTTTPSIV